MQPVSCYFINCLFVSNWTFRTLVQSETFDIIYLWIELFSLPLSPSTKSREHNVFKDKIKIEFVCKNTGVTLYNHDAQKQKQILYSKTPCLSFSLSDTQASCMCQLCIQNKQNLRLYSTDSWILYFRSHEMFMFCLHKLLACAKWYIR